MTAYLFDRQQGKSVDDWAESLHGLNKNQILWIDLMDTSKDEAAGAQDRIVHLSVIVVPGRFGKSRTAQATCA